MIELSNVSKVFNEGTVNENLAINDISLSIKEGDFITVIGSNGAGKSTLFNLIAGSYEPSRGRILVNGKDVTRESEHRRAGYIGRIFQNPLLGTAGKMTIEENMLLAMKKGFKGLKIGLSDSARESFRRELVHLDMKLEDRLKDKVSLLSGGQRQSLTLLMTVYSRPSLLLLDEHTAALDPKNAAIVLNLTARFVKEHGLTAMMITHNMGHAIEFGNRLLMMDKGEVILDVSGEEKKSLTVQKLVDKFHELRNEEFESDRVMLSE